MARARMLIAGMLVMVPGLIAAAQNLPNALTPQPVPIPYFSDEERARIVQYWNTDGRYEVGARQDPATGGPFAARLTPEASTWFWTYNRAVKKAPIPAGQNPTVTALPAQQWENWIEAKVKYDWAVAQHDAEAANAQSKGTTVAPVPVEATITAPMPPHPGPMPADLLEATGDAPLFAASVAPKCYTVRFDTGEVISYNDCLSPRNPRFAYLRFTQGVASGGTALSKLPPEVLDKIFADGDMTPTEARVMRAISLLEGGFDSINTYDTGYLSVGFIQFAALKDGGGSLGSLLRYQKRQHPQEFNRDFRAFGVDVTDGGALVVVDPALGAELLAGEAVRKIIDDKRLTAVFHLAGKRSLPFRSAQLFVAKDSYYPIDLPVEVKLNEQVLTGKVRDVIQSEAGIATLFDRKVNTGNIRLLNTVLSQIMSRYNLTALEQVLPYEREIIMAMKWRRDFLKDPALSQPQ